LVLRTGTGIMDAVEPCRVRGLPEVIAARFSVLVSAVGSEFARDTGSSTRRFSTALPEIPPRHASAATPIVTVSADHVNITGRHDATQAPAEVVGVGRKSPAANETVGHELPDLRSPGVTPNRTN